MLVAKMALVANIVGNAPRAMAAFFAIMPILFFTKMLQFFPIIATAPLLRSGQLAPSHLFWAAEFRLYLLTHPAFSNYQDLKTS